MARLCDPNAADIKSVPRDDLIAIILLGLGPHPLSGDVAAAIRNSFRKQIDGGLFSPKASERD
jgi:hypothetical protein